MTIQGLDVNLPLNHLTSNEYWTNTFDVKLTGCSKRFDYKRRIINKHMQSKQEFKQKIYNLKNLLRCMTLQNCLKIRG